MSKKVTKPLTTVKHFRLLLSLIIILGFFPCSAQETKPKNPLADAIAYMEAYNSNNYQKAISILSLYRDTVSRGEGSQEYLTKWIQVPDTIGMGNDSFNSFSTAEYVEYKSLALSSDSNMSISSISTPLTEALSSLIASRFKEELSIAFLEGFRNKLNDEESELKVFFPITLNVLLNEDVFNTSLWLTTLRAALDADLQNLPSKVPHLLELINKNIEDVKVKVILEISAELYEPTVQFINNPNQSYVLVKSALEQFNVKVKTDSMRGSKLDNTLRISEYLIGELGNQEGTDWISTGELNKLKDLNFLKTFYGFVLEKNKAELRELPINTTAGETNLYNFLADPSNVPATITHLKGIVDGVLKVAEDRKALKRSIDKARISGQNVDIKEYISFGESVFDEIILIADLTWLEGSMPEDEADKITVVLKDVKELFPFAIGIKKNIETRNYSKVLVDILNYLPKVVDQKELDKSVLFAEFLKYANLAVGLASAKTAEEMAAVINAAALPVQSYRLKRKSPFSITLNAYAGGFYGVENLNNKDVKNQTAGLLAFAAPVGVGFNWALGTKYKEGKFGGAQYKNKRLEDESRYLGRHSLSLFVSVIDIGALAAYRLKDDQTPVDEIELQNIFAPGAQLIFGFGRTPLSLGAGIQYGPELRRVEAADNALTPVIESRGWRFGVSLMVDIPLLEVHKKATRASKHNKS